MVDSAMLGGDALRSFVVFADHLNFTTAAAALHISQPALHAKVRKLGEGLGLALYERQGRGLVLTDAGRQLAAFGREQRQRVDDFVAAVDPADAPVAVAAGRSSLRWLVGEGIGRLSASGRRVRVMTADREAAIAYVLSGVVDVAVIGGRPAPDGLCAQLVGEYPQVLVVPAGHPLAGRRRCRLADVAGNPLVLPPGGRPHRQAVDAALAEAGLVGDVVAEVDGWDLLVHFAALGIGVTIVNGYVPMPDGLVAVHVTDLPPVRYWAIWRPARQALVETVLPQLVPTGRRRGTAAATGPVGSRGSRARRPTTS